MKSIVFCPDEMLRALFAHGYTVTLGVSSATVFWRTRDGQPGSRVLHGKWGLYNWMCDCELL